MISVRRIIRTCLLTFSLTAVSIIIVSCGKGTDKGHAQDDTRKAVKTEPKEIKGTQTERTTIVPEPSPQLHKEKTNLPSASGVVNEVPWENDEKFLNLRNNYGTPIRMAAYCTVLRDPLPGEEDNVHHAASLLSGTVLQPGQTFSQNKTIGPYDEARGFKEGPTYLGTQLTTTIGGGVCKIASTLYNVAVLSNLEIIERHPHGMPVPYVPYGQDATVAYGQSDFRFRNNTGGPVLIWAQGVDNVLYIAFYGKNKPPEVVWQHEKMSIQKAGTIYKKNPSLASGVKKIAAEGLDGAVVKSWVIVKGTDGFEAKKFLGTSNYKPMPHIVETGC